MKLVPCVQRRRQTEAVDVRIVAVDRRSIDVEIPVGVLRGDDVEEIQGVCHQHRVVPHGAPRPDQRPHDRRPRRRRTAGTPKDFPPRDTLPCPWATIAPRVRADWRPAPADRRKGFDRPANDPLPPGPGPARAKYGARLLDVLRKGGEKRLGPAHDLYFFGLKPSLQVSRTPIEGGPIRLRLAHVLSFGRGPCKRLALARQCGVNRPQRSRKLRRPSIPLVPVPLDLGQFLGGPAHQLDRVQPHFDRWIGLRCLHRELDEVDPREVSLATASRRSLEPFQVELHGAPSREIKDHALTMVDVVQRPSAASALGAQVNLQRVAAAVSPHAESHVRHSVERPRLERPHRPGEALSGEGTAKTKDLFPLLLGKGKRGVVLVTPAGQRSVGEIPPRSQQRRARRRRRLGDCRIVGDGRAAQAKKGQGQAIRRAAHGTSEDHSSG